MLGSFEPSLKFIEWGVNRSCPRSVCTAGQHIPGVIQLMRLRPHNFEKATLNAVVLVWYLLNLDLGSPSEKMHAHPRSHFSKLTRPSTV